MTTLLRAPLVVESGGTATGHYQLAADFRLTGGDLGGGLTALGAITVRPGARGVTLGDLTLDGSALDPHAPDWQQTQVRGIHLPRVDNVTIFNSEIHHFPRQAIYAAGCRGLEIHHSVSERTESFLDLDYFTGVHRRANSHVYVWGHCQHKNGRSFSIPGAALEYVSVIDPRYFIGSNGINAYVADAEIADFSAIGEYKGTLKLCASHRVRVLRCHGANQMLQGSVYFDFEKGPNEINGPNGQLPFPFGPPGTYSTDITFESCIIDPQFSLWRVIDDPLQGGNTLQLSYPQWNTKVVDCDFWWQPSAANPFHFACIQLYRTGYPVDIRGCRFHNVPVPANIPQPIWGANNAHGIGILDGPGKPEFYPSSANADWLTANTWDAP